MTNWQLILLRHAKSDWASGARNDFERPLNPRGRRDAPRVGRWLARNGYLPHRIAASPSARTTETTTLILDAMTAHPHPHPHPSIDDVAFEQRLYHGMPDDIHAVALEQFACIDSAPGESGRVLIVAHNPGMELVLRAYCPSAPPFADGKYMPTCAVAVIDLAAPDAPGVLRALVRPSELP